MAMDSELPWKPPVSRRSPLTPRDHSHDDVQYVFQAIQAEYDRDPLPGDFEDVVPHAYAVSVGSHLPRYRREELYRKLCFELKVEEKPVRLGVFLGWGIPTRGRFLDLATRYQETIHRCGADPRLALVERREPARGRRGRLYTAFVVIAVESSAFPNGYPSQSLRDWLKSQGPMMRPRD